jgi:hypothetical protein
MTEHMETRNIVRKPELPSRLSRRAAGMLLIKLQWSVSTSHLISYKVLHRTPTTQRPQFLTAARRCEGCNSRCDQVRRRSARNQPTGYQRAVVLLSETIDGRSQATLEGSVRDLNDTNTAIYAFGFSSAKAAVSHEATKPKRHAKLLSRRCVRGRWVHSRDCVLRIFCRP